MHFQPLMDLKITLTQPSKDLCYVTSMLFLSSQMLILNLVRSVRLVSLVSLRASARSALEVPMLTYRVRTSLSSLATVIHLLSCVLLFLLSSQETSSSQSLFRLNFFAEIRSDVRNKFVLLSILNFSNSFAASLAIFFLQT